MTKSAPLFNRLALIGVGLIGSSIARAARAQGAVREIVATARAAALDHAGQVALFAALAAEADATTTKG